MTKPKIFHPYTMPIKRLFSYLCFFHGIFVLLGAFSLQMNKKKFHRMTCYFLGKYQNPVLLHKLFANFDQSKKNCFKVINFFHKDYVNSYSHSNRIIENRCGTRENFLCVNVNYLIRRYTLENIPSLKLLKLLRKWLISNQAANFGKCACMQNCLDKNCTLHIV